MPDEWFILKDGKQHGPTSYDKLKSLSKKGKISASDMVKEGSGEWQAAHSISDLGLTIPVDSPVPESTDVKYPNLTNYLSYIDTFADLAPAIAIFLAIVMIIGVTLQANTLVGMASLAAFSLIPSALYVLCGYLVRFFLRVFTESARVLIDIEENTRK